ncbi:ferrous iron transport protein A [bacterium]|nr:ferrous iron transport protein A [bacterium]
MVQSKIVSLTMILPGQRVRVVSLSGGRGLRSHLIGMGLNVGEEIEVVHRGAPGPFLVAVKETRLAIGQGMAQKIMVSVELPGRSNR